MLLWGMMVTVVIVVQKVSGQLVEYRPKQEFLCRNFTEGNLRQQEFYSPNYPLNYPPKIECVLVLKADFGYFVRIDFRDQFDLEPSDGCDHDFLEVRDGAHGYSPLIGRFCGKNFPPIITSSDRALFLRFSSDETIEYSGFRAVYQYIPNTAIDRPDHGPCRFDLEGYEGILGTKDISAELRNYTIQYDVPIDCTWIITVQIGYKVQLTFPLYQLEEPNECDVNFLDIFGATTDLRNRLKHFCGSMVETVSSKTNVLHVRFYAEPRALKSKFEAIFTAYRDLEGKCLPDEFDCEDATCIPLALRCNGRHNCRFRWDEEGCVKKKSSLLNLASKDLITIMVIGILLVLGICGACFFNCIRKLRQDHQVYKARRSRSREDRLDEATRSILEGPRSIPPDLSSLHKANGRAPSDIVAANGEVSYVPADVEYDDESDAHVEMVDCEVQTRDSLFRDSGRTSNSSDAPKAGWIPNLMRSTEPPRTGWAPTPLRSAFFPTQRSPLSRYEMPRDDYRSEAVIEMAEQSKGRADVLAKM